MLQLNFKAAAKLLRIDLFPVKAKRCVDLLGFLGFDPTYVTHHFLTFSRCPKSINRLN
jgi:hypothetical protein